MVGVFPFSASLQPEELQAFEEEEGPDDSVLIIFKSRTSTHDPEREGYLSPDDARDFEYGVRSRDYDNCTPLHIPSLQGWIDVSGHVLIHGRIDMLLLPFMVIGFSSVSPIEDGSAKSQCDLWKKIQVYLCGDCLRECSGKSRHHARENLSNQLPSGNTAAARPKGRLSGVSSLLKIQHWALNDHGSWMAASNKTYL